MTDKTPKTITYTLPDFDFDAKCPFVPEGATDWEAQEIRKAWQNCQSYARDAVNRICWAFEDDRLPDTHPAANEVQAAAQFVAARAELRARIEGVKHRLARRRIEAEERAAAGQDPQVASP